MITIIEHLSPIRRFGRFLVLVLLVFGLVSPVGQGAIAQSINFNNVLRQLNDAIEQNNARQQSRGSGSSSQSDQPFDKSTRERIQGALNARGFDAGSVDGVFGSKTREAIADFQASIGSRRTGQLTNPELQILLNSADAQPTQSASRDGTGQLELLYDYDLPGNDYRHGGTDSSLKGITLNACQAACLADGQCRAFTYNSNAKWCFLKGAASTPVGFSGAISGRFTSGENGTPVAQVQFNQASGFGSSVSNQDSARNLSPNEIRLLQRGLNILKYDAGRVDGVMGRGTRSAVHRFLTDYNHDTENTSEVESLRLIAEKAGLSDQLSPALLAGYSEGRAQNGEVSVFTLDEDRMSQIDFSDASLRLRTETVNTADYTPVEYPVDNKPDDATLGLIAMMITANPAILSDQQLLADLYEIEGGTYESSYRVNETLAAFREDLERRAPPSVLQVSFQTNVSLARGEYSRTDGLFPFQEFDRDDLMTRFSELHMIFAGTFDQRPKLQIELPDLPNITAGVPMTLEQAEALERTFSSKEFKFTRMKVYVVIDGMRYDANRHTYVAQATFRKAQLVSRYTETESMLYEWLPQPALTLAREGYTPTVMDLADFMNILPVRDGHVVNDRAGRLNYRASDGWDGIAASLLLSKRPDALQNDTVALRLANTLLTDLERESLWQDVDSTQSQRGMNEFDRADTADRVRDKFADLLMQRSVTTPFKLVEVRDVDLQRYDFEASAYGMRFDDDRNLDFPQDADDVSMRLFASMGQTLLPQRLELPENLARQLDGLMRVKGDRRFYLAIYNDVVGMSDPVDGRRYGAPFAASLGVKVTRIALYADRGLTQLVYDFYSQGGLKDLQDSQTSVFAAYALKAPELERVLVTVKDLTGNPDVITSSLRTSRPYREANEIERLDVEPQLQARFEQTSGVESYWLTGTVELGQYDVEAQKFDISSIKIGGFGSETDIDIELKHEVLNLPTSIEVPLEEAKRLLEKYPGREFGARLSMTPVSASWDSGGSDRYDEPKGTIAANLDELYVLAGTRRISDRDMAIIKHEYYAPYVPFIDNGASSSPSVQTAGTMDLSQDLAIKLAMSGMQGEVSDRSLRWLLSNQWLADTGRVPGTGTRFFDPNASRPTEATADTLLPAYKQWLADLEFTPPERIGMIVEMGHTRLSVGRNGNSLSLSVDRSLVSVHCGNVEMGYRGALAQTLGIDATQSRSRYEQVSDGSAQNPRVLTSPMFRFLDDSPLECGGRDGEHLSDNFVGDSRDWQPQVTFVFDKLPVPPTGISSTHNMMEIEASVSDIEVVANGDDVPHLVVRLRFDTAKIALFSNDTVNIVNTIARADLDRPALTNADGSELDVVGVQLGMTEAEAEAIIAQHMPNFAILTSNKQPQPNQPPFSDVKMYINADQTDRIALYFERGTGDRIVLGVQRVVSAPNWGLPRPAVAASARKKYGEPVISDFSEYETRMVWTDMAAGRDNISSYCLASGQGDRIEDWLDQSGVSHKIYEYFDWERARDSGMAYSPSIDALNQLELVESQDCRVFVQLEQNQFGLNTLLIDPKAYAEALNTTRDMLERQFHGETAGAEAEPAIEVKL